MNLTIERHVRLLTFVLCLLQMPYVIQS
jgi:hypothetical protein